MTREEYLQKMQELREEQQKNAREHRETLDRLNDDYRALTENMKAKHIESVREIRDNHTARQHDIERRMNDLKMEWAREHPVEEVKILD